MNWSTVPGFGVAGNFTGHLEQAGESPDFINVQTAEAAAPKGMFPFYIPADMDHYLSTNPYSHSTIRLLNEHENHQIEPELSILFSVQYQGTLVKRLIPTRLFAHNDCSIRRKGARKISEKKNWGAESKGVSQESIAIESLDSELVQHLHLGCYLIRDGVIHDYGLTSPVCNYSYFNQQLLDWMVLKLNTQENFGPLENLKEWLQVAGQPNQILVSVGATKYTNYGESTFLKPNDVSVVVLYDSRKHTADSVNAIAQSEHTQGQEGLVILKQLVR